MKKTILHILSTIALLASCATIVNGPTEEIPVTTIPPGATVSEGQISMQTPGNIGLARKRDHILVITKPGFLPQRVKLVHVLDGWVAGNIVSFGIIGAGIDAASGGMWDLKPDNIVIFLQPATRDELLPFQQAPNVTK